MASPQPDRFTRISNELLREIYRFPFNGTQLRVIFAIIRYSYGWNRKETEQMGYKKMSRELNMPRSSIQLALNLLVEMNVLIRNKEGGWALNKDYEKWVGGANPLAPGGPASCTPGGQSSGPGGASPLAAYKEKDKHKDIIKTTTAEVKKLTPAQKLIRYYKEAKGINANDTDWDRRNYCGRLVKEANSYLKAFDGDIENAGKYLLVLGQEWEHLDWGLPGAKSRAGRDIRINGEKNGREHSEVGADRVDGQKRVGGTTQAGSLVGDTLRAIEATSISAKMARNMAGSSEDSDGDGSDVP